MHGLSAEEQEQVDRYRRLLYPSSSSSDFAQSAAQSAAPPLRAAYDAARRAHEAAVQDYQARREAANTSDDPRAVLDFARNGARYRRRVQDALAAWVSGGYKNEVEQMEAYIAQVTGAAPPTPP